MKTWTQYGENQKPQPLENTNTAKAKDWKAKTNTKKGGGEESTHGRN